MVYYWMNASFQYLQQSHTITHQANVIITAPVLIRITSRVQPPPPPPPDQLFLFLIKEIMSRSHLLCLFAKVVSGLSSILMFIRKFSTNKGM